MKEKNLHVNIVSIDLAKAYNRAWTPRAIEQLIDWGLSGNILHFVRNFLTNRTLQVTIGDTRSRVLQEETGVPQGSVLAVTLFLTIMDNVFRNLPKNVHALAYADDILLICIGKTMPALFRRTQAAVRAVEKWAIKTGFQLAPNKSSLLHCCSSNHHTGSRQVILNGIPLKHKKKRCVCC